MSVTQSVYECVPGRVDPRDAFRSLVNLKLERSHAEPLGVALVCLHTLHTYMHIHDTALDLHLICHDESPCGLLLAHTGFKPPSHV